MRDDLPDRLAAISELDLDGLRRRWRMLSGKPASTSLPRALLIRLIAYRMQVDALGGLDRETKRVLDGVARSLRDGAGKGQAVPSRAGLRRLLPGTHLVREHDGVMHRVMVLEEGFACNGTVYGSLSAVAHAITGTKWNGYRFFGIKEVKGRGAGPAKLAFLQPDGPTQSPNMEAVP